MPESEDLEVVNADPERSVVQPLKAEIETAPQALALQASAAKRARALAWIPDQSESRDFNERCNKLLGAFEPLLKALEAPPSTIESNDFRGLQESVPLLKAELQSACRTFEAPHTIPQVRTQYGETVSRTAAIADDFLAASSYQFSEAGFANYIQEFQKITVLKVAELWMLIPVMKLVLLEQIANRAAFLLRDPSASDGVQHLVRSLQEIKQTSWKAVIEPLILFDQVLREDPAGSYARMDYDSRELYRRKVVEISDHCDWSEIKVATEVLAMSREAQQRLNDDPRVTMRASHVGAYLLAEGRQLLEARAGFNPPFREKLRAWLRRHPDDFLLPGIAILTVAICSCVVLLLTQPSTPLTLVFFALAAVLLPSSQSAVQIMNYLATLFLQAQIIPKLDFSQGLPDDCVTLVAIPSMLLNESQVRKLVDALEVRFIGNQDPNLHFALLTDLPDSPSEPLEENALVDLAGELIQQLNHKYAAKKMGAFFLLHRHRVYNPRERLWMGWERKRGKLMDLNNLLRGQFDSFPHKVGNLSLLPSVRYVITLDSDTDLPRGSARRMAGALAHPLNQAIIDRDQGIVVAGYGILQPRVGVSVQSTARSRLATIYSGQTGLDIYTHAASDVYQDLYGEGIFVGKGIYEVETLHAVLHGRFPRNALLSHDLMEGAYARAGLVSDIEVIEDYPSHYSAHNRRKHRWVRGDWQITEWLMPLVPDESGRRVPNPLSVISRWKILDNLRRSLFEPALFLLFLFGWTCLPGKPSRWTEATIAILFLPALVQLGVELVQAAIAGRRAGIIAALDGFLNASIANVLTITFLAHQALLSIDAVVRTLVRRLITRKRLLEWETAAEAELAGDRRTMLDIYLNWTPALSAVVFILVALIDSRAVLAALPILILWSGSKPISQWLNRPPRAPRRKASESNQRLLRAAALRTWRYFSEFSTEEHHWLIPDNVQEEGTRVAPRISPTNLGFLFNARQVACEFGYLTVPEFIELNLHTLETASKMDRHKGHFLNWYDTRSLAPLSPPIISSVDNGNLVASLWTLQEGCLQVLWGHLLRPELADGIVDCLRLLSAASAFPRRKVVAAERALRGPGWIQYVIGLSDATIADLYRKGFDSRCAAETRWFQEELEKRIRRIRNVVELFAPWRLPEFEELKDDATIRLPNRQEDIPTIERTPAFIDSLSIRLQAAADLAGPGDSSARYQRLLLMLPGARARVVKLIDDLKDIAERARILADEMDFAFLLNRRRGLLSVAYEVEKQKLLPACYDLLASEARIAYLVAIAKDEIPQDSWFLLGRAPTEDSGVVGLLSWTGTMFEYLMPTLWTRIYPNTLLERTASVAVRLQQDYAIEKEVLWGISESACSKMDEAGNYQYFPFGVPNLAIHKPDEYGPVISPYSTLIALNIDPTKALENLRTMQRQQWIGAYGFYEALDFSPQRGRSHARRPQIVRCWMAHHQGMSLLSIANFLRGEVVQNWFHSHPRVKATELLLQEKPVHRLSMRMLRARAA
jgi:cyclic beta-1,2-glucan synthetase